MAPRHNPHVDLATGPVRVISLAAVPPAERTPGRGRVVEALWRVVEQVLITNSLQPSSRVRTSCLRAFGAQVGERVIIRPRVRVRFPWNLEIGDDCWIGEGVWISNRDKVTIESDVVVSQETFITTGSHAAATDMRVTTAPVTFRTGSWTTARCVVLGGVEVGRSAVITPGTVVSSSVPPGVVFGQAEPQVIRRRFRDEGS